MVSHYCRCRAPGVYGVVLQRSVFCRVRKGLPSEAFGMFPVTGFTALPLYVVTEGKSENQLIWIYGVLANVSAAFVNSSLYRQTFVNLSKRCFFKSITIIKRCKIPSTPIGLKGATLTHSDSKSQMKRNVKLTVSKPLLLPLLLKADCR